MNLGNIYLREERFDAAQQLFAQALAADSTHANAYNSLGNLHLMRRDFAVAAAAFASAVRLAPDDPGFRETFGYRPRVGGGRCAWAMMYWTVELVQR